MLLDSVPGVGFYYCYCRAAVQQLNVIRAPPALEAESKQQVSAGPRAVVKAALVRCAHRQLLTEQAILQRTSAQQ